jgi:hypothetical protein
MTIVREALTNSTPHGTALVIVSCIAYCRN